LSVIWEFWPLRAGQVEQGSGEKSMDGEGNLDGGTKAAIGKSTGVVEEHNDWAEFDDGV